MCVYIDVILFCNGNGHRSSCPLGVEDLLFVHFAFPLLPDAVISKEDNGSWPFPGWQDEPKCVGR